MPGNRRRPIEDEQVLELLLGKSLREGLSELGVRAVLSLEARKEDADLCAAEEWIATSAAALEAARLRQDRFAATGEMTAGLVHELRNMFSSIKGFAELGLRRVEHGRDATEVLSQIMQESTSSLTILAERLEFTHAKPTPHVAFEANAAIRDALKLVAHQLQLGRVKLDLSLAQHLPCGFGQPTEFKLVVVNLLINAEQAMEGGGTIRIETRADEDGMISVQVCDTGPGVPADLHKKIFEPTYTTKESGTGWGLTVARKVLENMGGSLTVADSPGGGACFTAMIRSMFSKAGG